MSSSKHPHEDGGYGNSNLVGDNRSGLRSAIEGREAVDAAREPDTAHRAAADHGDSLGRLTDRGGGPRMDGPDSSAGTTLDDDGLSSGHGGRNGLED